MKAVRPQPETTVHVAMSGDRRFLLIALVMVGVGMVLLAYGPGFVLVRASTANVAVQWVIPTDKTITVSYPTAETSVNFQPSTGTFARQVPVSQTDVVAAFRVTNNGNVAVELAGTFLAHMQTGIAEYRIANASSGGAPSTGQIWWCGDTSDTGQSPAGSCTGTANDTSSRTMMGAANTLAVGANHDWWAWSWGTAVAAGTHASTLQITSS